ncbi:hypothetical protein CBL_06460 [Carabus blaptoides fortunei]
MSELHIVVGTSLVAFGTGTGSYLAYNLHNTRTSRQVSTKPNIVILSETLAAVAIGILHIYTYAYRTSCSTDTATNLDDFNQTRKIQDNNTIITECEVKFECSNWEIVMEQIVLTATAIHCLLSLVTTSFLCKNCVIPKRECSSPEEPSTSSEKTTLQPRTLTRNQSTIGFVIAHWILPILTVFCLYYSMKMADAKQICQNVTLSPNIVDNFQTLISELLENPVNVTEKSIYETEIDNIVGKVYSIVESATENEQVTPQMADIDEGFSVLHIMDKLNSVNNRVPKQLKLEQNINTTGFKIYTLFFILLGFITPIIYANIESLKLKMQLETENYTKMENKLKELIKYLNLSIISVLTLWTPSFVETFSRTYITESQPNMAMQILMAIGSVHMIFRNGLNVKLLKILSGQSNTVQPTV